MELWWWCCRRLLLLSPPVLHWLMRHAVAPASDDRCFVRTSGSAAALRAMRCNAIVPAAKNAQPSTRANPEDARGAAQRAAGHRAAAVAGFAASAGPPVALSSARAATAATAAGAPCAGRRVPRATARAQEALRLPVHEQLCGSSTGIGESGEEERGHTLPVISLNKYEMWFLVQGEFLRQPKRFSITATTTNLIPVASIHEYVYRIYLLHFRDPAFVTSRLLDLLASASRLDTQSCKVLLFCRLLNLLGVDPLSEDAFWFVLKALHILQRACASTGNYFHLDASGENEFIPQSSATEALSILFRGATNDVMKRLRLRLAGLASVYGTIWIPASSIIEFVMEEWKTAQDSLQMAIKEKIAQEQCAENAVMATATKQVPSFDVFLRVFSELHLKPHRLEAVQAYRQLISSSKQPKKHASSASNGSVAASSGIHFGPASDALISANRHLSFCFLKATWEQTKKDFIRWLDVEFHDIGLQVRLIQQMDNIVNQEEAAIQVGWKSLQQLIQITSTGKLSTLC